MIGKIGKMKGLAQIPLMIGLLIMAVAIPAATKLVQQQQDKRSSAAGSVINGNTCAYSNAGAKDCVGNVVYFCTVGNDRMSYWQSSTDCTKSGQVCSKGSCVTPCSSTACTACTTSTACSAASGCSWGYVGSSLSCSKTVVPAPVVCDVKRTDGKGCCKYGAKTFYNKETWCVSNTQVFYCNDGQRESDSNCGTGKKCDTSTMKCVTATATTPTGSAVTNTADCGNLKGQCASFSTSLSNGAACSVGGKTGTVQTGLCGGGTTTVCCKNGAGTAPYTPPAVTSCTSDTQCSGTNKCVAGKCGADTCSATCFTPYTSGQSACTGFNTSTTGYTGSGKTGTTCGTVNLCCTKTTYTKPSVSFSSLTSSGMTITGSASCSTCNHMAATINGKNINMTKGSSGVFTLSYTAPSVGSYTAVVKGCSISTSGSVYNDTCPSGALTEASKSVTVTAPPAATTYNCSPKCSANYGCKKTNAFISSDAACTKPVGTVTYTQDCSCPKMNGAGGGDDLECNKCPSNVLSITFSNLRAVDIYKDNANLQGIVTGFVAGTMKEYWFVYGPGTNDFSKSTTKRTVGGPGMGVNENITGLASLTEYSFKMAVVDQNSFIHYSDPQKFKTTDTGMTQICVPKTFECADENNIRVCDSTGTQWGVSSCSNGCSNNKCNDALPTSLCNQCKANSGAGNGNILCKSKTNGLDISTWIKEFDFTSPVRDTWLADLNCDSRVNADDLSLIISKFSF